MITRQDIEQFLSLEPISFAITDYDIRHQVDFSHFKEQQKWIDAILNIIHKYELCTLEEDKAHIKLGNKNLYLVFKFEYIDLIKLLIFH